MITLDLNTLSLNHALELLRQEGYIAEELIEKSGDNSEHLFIYPYSLYDADNNLIDTVYFIEHCIEIEDDEYTDGRKTQDVQKAEKDTHLTSLTKCFFL